MSTKRLRSDELDRYHFPSHSWYKLRKVAAKRKFPPNCGRKVDNHSLSNSDQGVAATPLPIHLNPLEMSAGKCLTTDIKTQTSNCKLESRMVDILDIQKKLYSYDHAASMERKQISNLKQLLSGSTTKNEYVVNSKEIESMDLLGLDSCANEHIRESSEFVKTGCGGVNYLEHRNIEPEVCESSCRRTKQTTSEKDNHLSSTESCHKFINLTVAGHDHPEAIQVKDARNLFNTIIRNRGPRANLDALDQLKKENKCVVPKMPFGHIPGIDIGDNFYYRSELCAVGLHCQLVSGIDYVVLDGTMFATSIVNSNRDKNETKPEDVLIYTGQGGYSKAGESICDQKLEKGNLALVNSKKMAYPVRVTHKLKSLKSTISSMRWDKCEFIYDGLYTLFKYWPEKTQNQKMVFMFELHRLPNQPRPYTKEVCLSGDISGGKERVKIRVLNSLNGEMPLPFSYMTNMVYPNSFEPVMQATGCNCINGCSDVQPCPCALKNGGKIPFNKNGAINLPNSGVVHECGPQCRCPPTCTNRVSQHGPKHQLEIFKTESTGWGLRSRNYISSGSFICEYVGEFLRDNEADERSNDEYLFDIFNDDEKKDGLAIDAAMHGNIGRFINHSCSPNLVSVNVLYDHGDERMPHIMFFAGDKILPFRELTFDYNYNINLVRDKDGNIKKKACYCGSHECTGRMY